MTFKRHGKNALKDMQINVDLMHYKNNCSILLHTQLKNNTLFIHSTNKQKTS